jgi:hypothetical protein
LTVDPVMPVPARAPRTGNRSPTPPGGRPRLGTDGDRAGGVYTVEQSSFINVPLAAPGIFRTGDIDREPSSGTNGPPSTGVEGGPPLSAQVS